MRLALLASVVLLWGCPPPPPSTPDAGEPDDAGVPSLDGGEGGDAGIDGGDPVERCVGLPLAEPPLPSPAMAPFAPGGAVEQLLMEQASLRRSAVGFNPAGSFRYFPADPTTTLPHSRTLSANALDSPAWSLALVNDVAGYARNACARSTGLLLPRVLREMVARNAMNATGTAPLRPNDERWNLLDGTVARVAPLEAAFERLFATRTAWPTKVQGVASSYGDVQQRVRALAAQLDSKTQVALARVLVAMTYAEDWRLRALQPWYRGAVDLADVSAVFASRATSVPIARARSFDHALMGEAAVALSQAVGMLAAHLRAHPLPDLYFHLPTPLGEVVLDGRSSGDTHAFAAPALLVDQHGEDTYPGVVAAPALAAVPLSVLIDLEGNDTYGGQTTDLTQGAGLFSFGFLIDMDGDDVYRGRDFVQGVGEFGVGMLVDMAGKDSYEARFYAQGSAQLGLGAALDLSGDDQWMLTSYGQGYGFVRSVGLLLDASGNDSYVAVDSPPIINPSPQATDHNVSFAQGAGFGMRGNDWPDTMSGGTGALVDLTGNDTYSCGVFGQGTGYWFGHGLLYDGSGRDSYTGAYYVQGGAAHFASATLIDESGDDIYIATHAVSHGSGHDGSQGYLLEGGGNDTYRLTSLSHGAGNDVGLGFFVDVAGDDTYGFQMGGGTPGFGQTLSADFHGTPREGMLSLGLFLDIGGAADVYTPQLAPDEARNRTTWKRPGMGWAPSSHIGIGRDGE